MTDSELLELTTEQLEAMTDEQLVAALGPALANCAPLPGSDEAEKARKLELKAAEEAAQLELSTTTNPDGTEVKMVDGIRVNAKKPRGKAKKLEAQKDKMKELLNAMAGAGINTKGLIENLPPALRFKNPTEDK